MTFWKALSHLHSTTNALQQETTAQASKPEAEEVDVLDKPQRWEPKPRIHPFPWEDREPALGAPDRPFSAKRDAAGCIVRMPDGKICVMEPRNHYSNVWHTFPKGSADPGERLVDTARREAKEECGLDVKLHYFVMDQRRSTSMTRYFVADVVGGSAQAFRRDETQATLQVPLRSLPFYMNQPQDQAVLWHILRSANLSGMLLDDAETRDTHGKTGRDRLHKALQRAAAFWAPNPVVDEAHWVEDLEPKRPPLRHPAEHEVLTPRRRGPAKVLPGRGNVTCIEAKSLHEVLPAVKARSVVIFDVDLTLTAFRHNPVAPWRSKVGTVERHTAGYVRVLQSVGVPVLGLTARAPHEAWGVLRDLEKNGIRLVHTALPAGTALPSRYDSRYENGVIFASDYNTKGDMLAKVHEVAPFTHAVMVDDNVNNFFSLARAARDKKFDLTCVYYQAALSLETLANQANTWDVVTKLAASPNTNRLLARNAANHREFMVKRRAMRSALTASGLGDPIEPKAKTGLFKNLSKVFQ